MSFNDYIHKNNLKNKATSHLNIYQVLSSIRLNNVEIHLSDGTFSTNIGIVKLHPAKGTSWVRYINEKCFDSYGCSPRQKLSKFNIKQNGLCLFSEYKIQALINKKDF